MQVIGNTTDTSYLATPLNKDSSYWFSVRAVHAGIEGRRAIAQNIMPNGGPCTATGLNNDLILDSLLAPVTGRQFTSSQNGIQRISIRVRNPGSLPTASPVSYYLPGKWRYTGNRNQPYSFAGEFSQLYSLFRRPIVLIFQLPGNMISKPGYIMLQIPFRKMIHSVTTIKNLRNDPLVLNPSFTEGFESALDQTYTTARTGLDSLDRADFSNSSPNGRLNSFFNTGFARTGKRSMLLDVTEQGTFAADSLINTFNLSNYGPTDQIWLDLYFKKQSTVPCSTRKSDLDSRK